MLSYESSLSFQDILSIPNLLYVCVDLQDLAVSSGSACTSASLEPSYVLRALGVEEDMAHTSLRSVSYLSCLRSACFSLSAAKQQ